MARLGPVWTLSLGAIAAAGGLLAAALAPWQVLALPGFALTGLGAANIVPLMFSAAGRLPNVAPAVSIVAVTTIGCAGLLLGPALIGFIAHGTSPPPPLPWLLGCSCWSRRSHWSCVPLARLQRASLESPVVLIFPSGDFA